MGKIKLHEIAKEIGLTSKEVVEKAKELRAQGISVSLIQMQEGRSKDDYLSYAMKDHVSKVEFIEEA